MGVFSDIELEWESKVFTIPSNRVMKAIALIEETITLGEFQAFALRGTAPLAKLCMAYGSVLRFAGARVTDDEVYDAAFSGEKAQVSMMAAIMNLMKMMLPAQARRKLEAATDDPKAADEYEAVDTGNSLATDRGTASSNKRTSQRSPKASGSRPASSGRSTRKNSGGSTKRTNR